MKGFMKKILSAGLAFALVFTMCPVLAYADTPQEAQEKTAETDEPKAETTEVKATGAEAPEVETTEVKAESADEKNTVLVYGRIEGSQHWTKDNIYYIVTDRWQKFTDEKVSIGLLDDLSSYCDEFLIHAVDVEGKAKGIEKELVKLLGEWGKIPVTYAGGVGSFEDLWELKKLGNNRLNVTIGSALDLFGGPMVYDKVLQYMNE